MPTLEMTEMLDFFDKDFKAAIIKMLQISTYKHA